jgi:hypothetical protein
MQCNECGIDDAIYEQYQQRIEDLYNAITGEAVVWDSRFGESRGMVNITNLPVSLIGKKVKYTLEVCE